MREEQVRVALSFCASFVRAVVFVAATRRLRAIRGSVALGIL